METRVRRTAGSDDPPTTAGDLQTIEGRAAGEENPPVVDALDSSSVPRVAACATDAASPDMETQQSALRADEADEGGGDPSGEPTDTDPRSTPTASRKPTASDISNPVAADGSAPIDSDADGLTDAREAQLGTDPHRADTDSDGLTDSYELAIGSNPTHGDTDIDDDGLTNAQERARGTNPTDRDTDDDGINDRLDRDPLRPLDSDLDGIPDHVERRAGLDPDHWDTDRDGLGDGDEIHAFGTDPKNPDSDGDGTNDLDEAWETYDATQRDTDGDGITDVKEARLGTDPTKADTDGDGLTDGREAGTGSLRDWTWKSGTGTDPLRVDSDADGVSDAAELERGADPLDPASQPLHEARPEDRELAAAGASTVASAQGPHPTLQADASSPMAEGAARRHLGWDDEQREFFGFGRVDLADPESSNEGEEHAMGTPGDRLDRDDADPTQRTTSDGSVLESADPASTAEAEGGSGAEPSTEAPPDERPDGRLTDGDSYEPPQWPAPPRHTEASSEGQTLTPAPDPEKPTLEGAQEGGSRADESAGLTREGGVYGEDDPRRSGDEEPTLDDKTKVDLSDTAPDGTPLREGLTDFAGNEISRSRDLGGGLPEGVAVPGSDRLSGMMDPRAAGETGGGLGAMGGRGGVDPRLAGGISDELPPLPGSNATDDDRGGLARDRADDAFSGMLRSNVTDADGLIRVGIPGLNDPADAPIEVTVDEEAIEIKEPAPLEVTVDEEAIEIKEPAPLEVTVDEEAIEIKAPADETKTVPAERPWIPPTGEQIESALRHRQPGYVDPPDDARSDAAGTQEVMTAGGDAVAFSGAAGGGAASPIPGGGVTDPIEDELGPNRGSQSGQPLNRDPGYVDPGESDTGTGGVPDPIADPTGGGGGGPTASAGGRAGTGDPRNAPTGGAAAQGASAEPAGRAPGAPPPGGGEVAVDPTEDEPQYGATTADADPLGMDIATAPPAGEAPAPPAPQGQGIGPRGQGGSEPAFKMDGGAVISMETGQVVAPPGPPPEPDLSGANLQGDLLGASESSGLPGSPGLETPPIGAPTDPGASESGDQPSSSDDEGMP